MELTEREQEIVNLLMKENTLLSVKEISKRLFLTEQTTRRRLKSLSEKDVVIRTYGGASLNYTNLKNQNIPLYLRMSKMNDEKTKIATKAIQYIKNGDLIFFDGSTTCFHMIPLLHQFLNLTVCTNSLKTATALVELKIKTILFGGEINNNLLATGYEVIEQMEKYSADVAFFSCDGISEDGILTDNSKESNVIRSAFMKNSKKKILLIDNSKFNVSYHNVLCNLKDIDVAVTDFPVNENLKNMPKEKWEY